MCVNEVLGISGKRGNCMKQIAKKAKMPRLLGAMFVTAAIAACAFAGTAFAADGFEADGVEAFYDDSYALMYKQTEKNDDSGYEATTTEYNLIDTNYNVLYTTDDRSDITDYGVLNRNSSTGLTGLNTYSGKTLLDQKYQAIGYNADSQMVFAAYGDKGKVVLEQYARGTSKATASLDIPIDAKDEKPWVYSVAVSETFVTVEANYVDPKTQESTKVVKMATYTAEGMELKDMPTPEGFDQSSSIYTITDGLAPAFYDAEYYKSDSEYNYTYEHAFYLPDGTAVKGLTGYEYVGNNFDAANGVAADRFLFVKDEPTKDKDQETTAVKSTAVVVDKDGNTLATMTEQLNGNGLFEWGVFGAYTYVTGSIRTETKAEGEEYYNYYTTYLPCKIYDASGNVAKEIANAQHASTTVGSKDKAQYLYVSAYANFDDSVKSYYSKDGKYRYSGSYTTYLTASLEEVPSHTVTRQNEGKIVTDEPQAYMLDGTKLYTGGKFAFDQDDNFVQRAGQYVTSIYNDLHRSTGGYYYGNGGIRVGSTDAYIATSDNGKFGIVASDGTELAASEYDGLYSQYNCELAMVKKDGKWYFVDLSGRARAEMFRLYNEFTGEHFYTSSADERDNAVAAGWIYEEGKGWIAPGGSTNPVFRLYNEFGGEHHYTTMASERDELIAAGWIDEGVGWFSDVEDTEPLFREYNPNMFSCNHNYTADLEEHAALVELGWENEGIAWYGVKVVEPMGDGAETAKTTETTTQSSDLAAAAL